jgi:hypothetical protein
MDYEFLLLEFQQPSGADGKLVLVGRPKSPEAASARDRALFHKPLSLPTAFTRRVHMSDSHGRFRVRRGEVEIEYEGPNFIQEYRAALAYFGIVIGAQTRLEDVSPETLPVPAMEPQTASHSHESPTLMLSGIQRPKMESDFQRPGFGLGSPGPILHQSDNSTSRGEKAHPSRGLVFNIVARPNQLLESETGLQSTELRKETKPLIENISHNAEAAYPTGMANDDKFKDVLKRLGLAI